MTTARALGHLALYYAPGDMEASRRLLQDLGCTLVENGPAPGRDGFCTVLVDDASPTYADNILFLAPLTPTQQELERTIRDHFRLGADDAASPATEFTEMKRASPETASHFAIRYGELEALEDALGAIEAMEASRAFTGAERPAFADHWIQCFVKTDLFGYGILAFGQTIELDYVFEPFFAQPPKFG
jgi:hypothetical protein